MTDSAWQDRIVGARMTTDREFTDRIEASSFSRQQWGLVMTAVEFEIENPESEEDARIVANTDKLSSVMPEMDRVEEQMGAMGGESGSASGSGSSSSGGFVDVVKNALGLGGSSGSSDEKKQEAASLAQEYADELQSHLEESGRWDEIRKLAAKDP